MPKGLDVFVISPEGLGDSGLPVAAARAGAVGLLNLCYSADRAVASAQLNRLVRLARGRYGAVLHGRLGPVEQEALTSLTDADTVLLTCTAREQLAEAVIRWRGVARRLGLIVTSEAEARLGAELGVDLLVAKGNEGGGQIGEETTFVLLQRLLARLDLPIYAWGGVGRNTAAACRVAGAEGVVLDWQLALMRESALAAGFRRRLALMDGSETVALRGPDGHCFRVYAQPGMPAKDQLLALSEKLSQEEHADPEAWDRTIAALMADPDPDARLWPVGQDAAFAATWAAEAPTVARALRLLEEHVEQAVRTSAEAGVLQADSPLAHSHGTTFPVLQGPMTRVSDVPEFCEAVAAGGGLPFLALALLRRERVRELLEQTRDRMGSRPWGVGILGFVERELRAEQLEVVEEVRPAFAIIAGGRPDQAASLEARGIATYLHVPSPGMLDTFVREGARRFIFEGRECGGHVGPRSSFVLWETMIGVLLRAELPAAEAAKVHVVFAGGIHDGRSGAMIAALAQPLVERGMKVGVLLGTAYLFTEEIVRTGAILPGFQEVALQTDHTVLVETGPGHAIRCADTPYVRHFENEKQRLRRQDRPAEEIRSELEAMNLGRLRIASKGIARSQRPGDQETRRPGDREGKSAYVQLDEEVQRRDGMYMIGQVAALRQGRCTIRQLHEDVCLGAQARLDALRRQPVVAVEPAEQAPPPLDVAIVGMACLLPGATTPDEFWHNILAKRDLIGQVPAHRFDAARWYDPERSARDKVNSKWGGFLNDIPFDPLKFGIPPTALRSIEPGQLLTLELVDRALIDAGYADHNPARARTSVIFGFSGGLPDLGQKYIVRAQLPQLFANPDAALWEQLPEWTEDSFAGILPNVIAGRVCNRFDFGGANFTVDAACASSLAAIYLACRSLADGTSDMVITGGCDVVQNAFAYLCFSKSGALSPHGRSRAFDAGADGIAISEGLAAVVLKRLADAERDGDRIYAVIRGVGAGSDGRSKGLTAPRVEGQMRTLERAYAQAGFSPATVGLFEAHGTGTAVGDATECQSLTAVLDRHGAPPRSAALGSVKSMIGHTKSSAGIAGLIKATLALHHRVLPPTLHVENPNPKAGLVDGPLYVNSELRPWLRGEHPRRAAVSSFGFGGTNFHVVLEEYEDHAVSPSRQTPHRRWPAELFTFAARSGADLAGRVRGFAEEIRKTTEAGAELELADLAYTLHRRGGTAGATHRASVVASGIPELLDQLAYLADLAAGESRPPADPRRAAGVYYTDQPLATDSPLAFVFPGQGAQFPDMLRDLAVEFAEVSDTFARADAILSERYGGPLSRFIFPPPAFSDAERNQAAEALKATRITQPALGVSGLALLRLLASFQLKPALAAGHSYGELVALCAAGSLDEAGLLALSWARADAMSPAVPANGAHDLGTMLAVQADRARVGEVLAGCADVWLANHNSPRQVVVSGSRQEVAQAAKVLEAAGIAQTPLAVSCAFHSPLMNAARQRFDQALATTDFQPPAFPVYSNVTAAPHTADPRHIRERLSEQITHEVRFVDEIEALYAAGARVFVELGPGRVAAKLVDQILGDRPHAAVAVQWRERHGLTQLLHALGGLFAQGVALSLERLYEGRTVRVRELRTPAALVKSPLGPHFWLVNGGDARPAAEPRRLAKPLLTHSPKSEATNGRAGSNGSASSPKPHSNGDVSKGTAMTARVSSPAATNGHAPAPNSSADADAYAQFQETMRRFLETQQKVMETFLLGTGMSAAEETIHVGQTFQPDDQVPIVGQALQPDCQAGKPDLQLPPSNGAPHTNGTPTAAAPAVALENLLLGIASERTGYPAEMLTLDANLEADLGIDSIKRVEIIGAFRRAALPSLAEPPAWFMERMTAAKTLRTICQGVAELVGGQKAADSGQKTEDREQANGKVEARPVEASSASGSDDLQALLLQIASERTGYPAEMLSLEANLEADLGIDSIKRVEIIGAFRRAAVPALKEPPAWFMEEMTAAKTFGAIVAGVTRLRGNGAGGSPPVKADELQSTGSAAAKAHGSQSVGLTEAAPRCVAGVVEVPLSQQGTVRLPAGAFILTDEGQGFAQELAHAIEIRGGRGCVLRLNDLTSRERTAQAVERVRQEHGPIAGVIHLLPLRQAPAFPDVDEATWSRFADPELKGLLYLLQALAPEFGRTDSMPAVALCMSRGGGDFGGPEDQEARHPWRGGLAGLLKTAALEWPGVRFRTIDVDELPRPEQLLREVVQEGPVEIGYRQGRRLTLRAQRREFPAADPATPAVHLGRDSVVLVTGGAQGITAEIVREFAEHTQASFILLGRSPEPPAQEDAATAGLTGAVEIRRALATRCRETGVAVTPREIEAQVQALLKARDIRRTLTAVRSTGARVEYISCNVRDATALQAVVADVTRRHGGVDALIHGAGIIEDAFLRDKTAASFDRVLGTKVAPLLTLTRVLDPQRLQLVMLFSSVAGFFGNRGQGDYAAANEILNRLARCLRRRWPGKVVSLNWGPWTGAGMVTPEVARQFTERGVPLVTVPAGRRAAWREVLHRGGSEVTVVLGPGPWVEAETVCDPAAVRVHTPLLADQQVYRRPGEVIEARILLDGERHFFLRHHRIDGKPVLPLAVALEFMAEAAAAAQPDWHVTQVRNLRMYSGVVLDDQHRELMLRAEPIRRESDGGEWRVRITDPHKNHRPLYEATVRLARELPPAPAAPPVEPIQQASPLSADEAYENWLFHGPAFQVIEQLTGLDPQGVDATVIPARGRRHTGAAYAGWLIDPIVLDAAPQVSLLWSRATYGTSALPNGVQAYHRYGPIGNEPVEMRWRVDSGHDGHTVKARVWFLREGRVVGQIDGLEGTGSTELNRIGGAR
jgi:acyl transferase domain-containing protein/NAD(P)H-dependent flavin oxidoreductase YrpB (nitropropane dioxygenase family)/NAD(P)-dependent dehydrogenase (short-subunit alcohol dehydrogenase family)